MSDHDAGQVSGSAAEIYDSFFVPALFGRFASAVADELSPGALESVLDVACGTGALTRELRSRTGGRVAGVDLNPDMLAVADRYGQAIEYTQADALTLPFTDDEFDAVVSQFGLMFVEDPVAAVREMRRVASRGVIAIWDAIEGSEGYSALQRLFAEHLGLGAVASLDAPFAMGTVGVFEQTLEAAGVSGATLRSVSGSARFASIAEWVTTEVRGWTLGESVDDEALAELVSVAERELARFLSGEECLVPMTARIASWA